MTRWGISITSPIQLAVTSRVFRPPKPHPQPARTKTSANCFKREQKKFVKAKSRTAEAFYKACRDARPKASESQQFAIDLILATTSIKDYAKLITDEVKRRGS